MQVSSARAAGDGAAPPAAVPRAAVAQTVLPGRVAVTSPHIALLLPLGSPGYAHAAAAVRDGFMAAAALQPPALPIRVYGLDEEDTAHLMTVYEQAVEAGAKLVVGPLTRNGVSALAAGSVRVPTLALNLIAPDTPQPPRLYLFGLAGDGEARQSAQHAYDDGRRKALLAGDGTPLSRRMLDTFAAEFQRRGGRVVEWDAAAGAAQAAARSGADMAFLAFDAPRLAAARALLPAGIMVYAPSRAAAAALDPALARRLEGLRYPDIPWLLQPDHPAVMVYPRPAPAPGDPEAALDLERLYAFGIDAYRVALELLQPRPDPVLDGVTGRIRFNGGGHIFERELVWAVYAGGAPRLLDPPR